MTRLAPALTDRESNRRFQTTTTIVYVAIGLIAFARILTAQFLSDDWEFLIIVERASSVFDCFQPLVGMFLRPLVVLLYYVNFKAFGLWTLPYHLMLVLVHVLNAWLVCKLAMRVDGQRRPMVGFLSGLLFLLFAGHTEAVSWVAGAADPLLLPFLIGSVLCFARGLDAPAPARSFVAGWALFALGMLAKEVGAILPAIAGAYGLLHASRTGAWRRTLTLTALFLSIPIIAIGGYLWMRTVVFGSAFGAYAEIGPPSDVAFWLFRAFLLRTFLPANAYIGGLWYYHRDFKLFAAAIVLLVAGIVVGVRRRDEWRGIVFSLVGVAIGLAPVVRLSISIVSTESERFVYVPSAFACMLIVQVLAALARPTALMATLVLAVVAANAWYLDRSNRAWQEAGFLADRILDSFIDLVRQENPATTRQVFLLNIPDSVNGTYVFRRGFYAALHLLAADLDQRPIQVVSSHTTTGGRERYAVRQVGSREFSVDIGGNAFLQATAPVYPLYEFPVWTRSSYIVRFTDAVAPSVVFAVTSGMTAYVGAVDGKGSPMGSIDTPPDASSCSGDSLTLTGWALDDEEVVRVVIEREDGGTSRREIGAAEWAPNAHAEIAQLFRGFPHVERATWTFALPCSLIRQLADRKLRVHVAAIDNWGHRTDLGARTIVSPQ